jgi:hypothetical protein
VVRPAREAAPTACVLRTKGRAQAGRPAVGSVELLFKCSPKTADKARKFSNRVGGEG